jgi:hypothetical protein
MSSSRHLLAMKIFHPEETEQFLELGIQAKPKKKPPENCLRHSYITEKILKWKQGVQM